MDITPAKLLIILMLAAVVATLFSAGFFLVKKEKDPKAMVKALTTRITLSIILIIGIILAMSMGWLNPRN